MTVVALTVPAGAKRALFKVSVQPVRWRDDGTNPTTSVGMLIGTADPFFMYTGDLAKVKLIQTAATATVDICYYN